jgi:hypothetical protein
MGFTHAVDVMPASGEAAADGNDAAMDIDEELSIDAFPAVLAGWQIVSVTPIEGGDQGVVDKDDPACEQGRGGQQAQTPTFFLPRMTSAKAACSTNLLEIRVTDCSEFDCFGVPPGSNVQFSQLFHCQCFAESIAG